MTEKELFLKICGIDEDGETNALVSIETKIIHQNTFEEDLKERITLYGPIVNIFKTLKQTIIDVKFESNEDIDFIKVYEMLKNFSNVNNSIDFENDNIPAICLNIMPKDDEDYVVGAVHGTWCAMSSETNKYPDTLRFIFDNPFVVTVKLIDDVEEDGDGSEE